MRQSIHIFDPSGDTIITYNEGHVPRVGEIVRRSVVPMSSKKSDLMDKGERYEVTKVESEYRERPDEPPKATITHFVYVHTEHRTESDS